MFGLDPTMTVLLIVCLACALFFEFINGFHDTANAVATVIYTNTLKPGIAVIWSGIVNAAGVFGILALNEKLGVANKIIGILPSPVIMSNDLSVSLSIVLAILITAILWNLGTWYFGIPCSSSHTLIGSIIGAGIGFSIVNHIDLAQGVKWSEATKIGLSLLISPMVGFSLTILTMYIFKAVIKNKRFFKEVENKKKPPFFTRLTLFATCTLVSYAHGSNDGQKGMGLIMLILIGFAPMYFAINGQITAERMNTAVVNYSNLSPVFVQSGLNDVDGGLVKKLDKDFHKLDSIIKIDGTTNPIATSSRFEVRKIVMGVNKNIDKLLKSETAPISKESKSKLSGVKKDLDRYVGSVPDWVKLLVSLALGLGTMIGWKRIVVTIGEKIGKQHLSYAQGASAELVAAATIQAATSLSLPVSTTQVLSSGIAGSMVASKGIKNLQKKTIKSIAIAWLLTFPVTVLLSGLLYLIFKAIF
jgi:phosphate/sulfate permease